MIDELLSTLRALADEKTVAEAVAAEAAPRLQTALRASAAAGTSPEGRPWAERKQGGRAYAGAAGHIEAKNIGAMVRVTLRGPEAYGHYGARGMPVRQMIPDSGAGMPPSVERALFDGANAVFERLTQ